MLAGAESWQACVLPSASSTSLALADVFFSSSVHTRTKCTSPPSHPPRCAQTSTALTPAQVRMINELEAAAAAARPPAQAAIEQPEWLRHPTTAVRTSDRAGDRTSGKSVAVGMVAHAEPAAKAAVRGDAKGESRTRWRDSCPSSSALGPGSSYAGATGRVSEPGSESSHASRGSFPGQFMLGWLVRRSSNGSARSWGSARQSGGAALEVHANHAADGATARWPTQTAPSPAVSTSPLPPHLVQPTGVFAEELQARLTVMNRQRELSRL